MSSGAPKDSINHLFVTLRRGLRGKPWFQKVPLMYAGLIYKNSAIVVPNTPQMRAFLVKVRHLIFLETPKQYWDRKQNEAESVRPLPPVIFDHAPLVKNPVGVHPRGKRLMVMGLNDDYSLTEHLAQFKSERGVMPIDKYPTTAPYRQGLNTADEDNNSDTKDEQE